MVSIAKNASIFDGMVQESKESAAKWVATNAERIDLAIYSMTDHGRFSVVNVRPRTVMTTAGPVRYLRRCYYDSFGDCYVCPLDSLLGVPPRAKVSTEMKRALVANASEMSYSMAGRHSSVTGSVSKSTVCRAVRDATVIVERARAFPRPALTVHVQIDEKYMGFVGSKRKRPRYTATIHSGRKPIEKGHKNRLLRRTIMSAESPAKLARKVNGALRESYGLTLSDSVWVSGDLARYIRDFPERITACSARYVPDKWHVCKALSDAYPEMGEIPPSAAAGILGLIVSAGDFSRLEKANALDLARLYQKDPECLSAWLEEGYVGCSQEGMNSHYYARRFGKLANRFKPSTVEKLCRIIEARENGAPFSVGIKAKEPPSMEELPWLGKAYEERAKWAIDTSRMTESLRKTIDAIRYGGLL